MSTPRNQLFCSKPFAFALCALFALAAKCGDGPPPEPAASEPPAAEPGKTKVPKSGVVSVDGKGRTPLHQAAIDGDVKRFRTLLTAGADPLAKDSGGKTPLDMAIDHGRRDIYVALVLDCTKLGGVRLNDAITVTGWFHELELKAASLGGCNLAGFRLGGADLTGADLRGANLEGADLVAARLGQAKLKGAKYDRTTRFSFGFDPVGAGLTSVGQAGGAGLIIELEQTAGFGDDYRNFISIRDGEVVVIRKPFGFLSDGPTKPVKFDKKLDDEALGELVEIARKIRMVELPAPEPSNPKRLDDGPCETRVTILLDGVRNEASLHCEHKNVLAVLEPLTKALDKLRDKILDENGYVEQGL